MKMLRFTVAVFFTFIAVIGIAQAQISPETRALMDRLSQLENQVQTQQHSGPQTIGSSAYSGSGVGIADPAAGNLELRMADLERQLRDMTGQIEQANFAAKKAQADLEKVRSDYDLRLQTLEHKTVAAPAVAATPVVTAKPEASLTTKDDSLVVSANDEDQTSAALKDAPKAAAKLGDEKPKPDKIYDDAYKAMQAKDYAKAQALYQQFLTENPKHSLAGNAQYWLGESYYARADYKNAGSAFAEAYQKYPKSPKAPDSLLKLGLSLSAQNRPKDACVVYKQLVKAYPTASGTIATKAESELKRLKCN